MSRLFPCIPALLLSASWTAASSRNATLDALLHAVEQRYNSAHTLTVHFTEKYETGRTIRRAESGELELRKPGRMRWNYDQPPGKLFLADGKAFYLYTPATNRVEKTPLRDSEDMRAPLAFLLGKLNFYKEFGGFELSPDGSDSKISAQPNSPRMPYSLVEFWIALDHRIDRLRVTGEDNSILDFTFSDEKLNPSITADAFAFHLPPGARIEEENH